MPTYKYVCDKCGDETEERREVDLRNHAEPCPACVVGWARRQFTPTSAIEVPAHFGKVRGWHLPPKDHPSWEHTQKEGTGHKKRSDHPTLKDSFRKAGLIR